MLLLAGSAGLSKPADFAAPLLPQEPRSFAMAHAMAATWTYLTRRAPQLSERRGFQAKKGVICRGGAFPLTASSTRAESPHGSSCDRQARRRVLRYPPALRVRSLLERPPRFLLTHPPALAPQCRRTRARAARTGGAGRTRTTRSGSSFSRRTAKARPAQQLRLRPPASCAAAAPSRAAPRWRGCSPAAAALLRFSSLCRTAHPPPPAQSTRKCCACWVRSRLGGCAPADALASSGRDATH